MNIFKKRIISVISAMAMLATSAITVPMTVGAESERYEFENGTLVGATVETTESGYSGSGYVYITSAGQTASITANVPSAGMYEVVVSYSLPASMGSSKIQNILINGVNQGQMAFTSNDGFTEKSLGMYKLGQGDNTITIESSWGWTMFDYATVQSATLPELKTSNTLVNAKATDRTQALMNYLADTYGNNIISGQQEIYGGGNNGDYELEFEWIKNLSGEYPAIRGFDFNTYNPLFSWDAGTTDRIVEWVNDRNGIATSSWHITVPKDMSAYTVGQTMDWTMATYVPSETNFNTANVLVEGTKENDFYKLSVEELAKQLQILSDNDVPLLFRPFHEAEGNGGLNGEGAWFWWASAGAEVYKELWIDLYTTLTEDYDFNNLIWEYNSYTYETSSAWYPGDNYVDIVGYDKYNATNWSTGTTAPNESAISGTFYNLVNMFDGKKMVAMTENDTIPTIENLTVEKAGWLYFCPWYGEHLLDSKYNNPETVKEVYMSDYTINLDDLPENLYSYGLDGPVVKVILGDVNCDNVVNAFDVSLLLKSLITDYELSEQGVLNADVDKDGSVKIADVIMIKKYLVGAIDKF